MWLSQQTQNKIGCNSNIYKRNAFNKIKTSKDRSIMFINSSIKCLFAADHVIGVVIAVLFLTPSI